MELWEFDGPWTDEEKQIVESFLKPRVEGNPWQLFKTQSGFSAWRQTWEFGSLTAPDLQGFIEKLRKYYKR